MKELRKTQLAVIKAECIDNIVERIDHIASDLVDSIAWYQNKVDESISNGESMEDSVYYEDLLKYKARLKAYYSIIDSLCK